MDKRQKKIDQLIKRIIGNQASRIALATQDHSLFFGIYFGPRYIKFESAPMHSEIFAITEDEKIKMAVITAFRDCGKSTIFTLSYPLWAILGKPQKKFVVILGQTQLKAQEYLRNIKHQLEGNELMRADLGPFKEESGQWGATALIIP